MRLRWNWRRRWDLGLKWDRLLSWTVIGLVTAFVLAYIAYGGVSGWFQHRIDQCRAVQNEEHRFESLTVRWIMHEERLPESDFKSFVTTLCRYYGSDFGCPMIVKNRDPWGHPFVYKVEDGGRKVILRSCGPNGHDDGGGGDDIQNVMLYPADIFRVKEPAKE